VLFVVLPLAVTLSGLAAAAFLWATRAGQFDDLETPAVRLLCDELTEVDGKTTITTTTLHKTVENRDGHVGSGMEAGMTEGYARLDALLAELSSELQQR